jgi:protease I
MSLSDLHVGIFVEKGFEDLEFWVPRMRLEEENANVSVIGTEPETTYEGKHGLTAHAKRSADQVDGFSLDAVVIPGGWCPDKLRRDEGVLELVRHCYEEGKTIGSICHAGWVPISADVVDGHEATGTTAIRDDLRNAGATWRDEAAFRDDPFVWGRVVKDIPDFCRVLIDTLNKQSS